VLENEKIRLARARQADEGLVVVLDDSDYFLSILQLHANRRGTFNQALEIFDLFKRLLRRARGLPGKWWRNRFS
jgi:hypothetical protein